MKAFLLAAGLGTRLRPITDNIPKCLIPINGKPLLYIWLDLLEQEGIEEVLINVHYLGYEIDKAITARKNFIKIYLFYEEKLLGSAGTLIRNKDFVKGEENFYFLFSDNLTNVSLKEIYDFHKKKDSLFTTYAYYTDVPFRKGIFEFDDKSGKVISFEEKPEKPKSNLASAGIGVLNYGIFNYIKNLKFEDFSRDVMPRIVDKMYVLKTKKYIKDIGTKEDYLTAQKEWMLIKS